MMSRHGPGHSNLSLKWVNCFWVLRSRFFLCQQRNIKIINHTVTIDPSKHLNESLFHLNKYGTIEFTNNFKKSLWNLN